MHIEMISDLVDNTGVIEGTAELSKTALPCRRTREDCKALDHHKGIEGDNVHINHSMPE